MRPLRAATTLLALCLGLAAPASAAEIQPLAFALLSDDQPVGRRTAGIRYVAVERGEVRLLQSVTTLDLPLANARLTFEQRLGARFGGDRGFTSTTRVNGVLREVQARLAADNTWSVSVVEGGEARTWVLAGDAVDLTSAELLDPERALPLLSRSTSLRLLSAETGQVLDGPVVALDPTLLEVGEARVPVQRFRWTTAEGPTVLAFTDDGVLVAYDFQAGGRLVGARMDRLPPPRTWGGGPEGPVVGERVEEEGL